VRSLTLSRSLVNSILRFVKTINGRTTSPARGARHHFVDDGFQAGVASRRQAGNQGNGQE
jgi:hypothetical protein